ncbi:tRNA (guanosine(46)-N7)-methyltransferase TrmB [Oligoflexia bacterium]|nr:tRNA (guanosine(46)-N7)-methyltransferase TrmB [Oligoflexia bacterium]
MKNWKWINQYIPLIDTCPEFIGNLEDQKIAPDIQARFNDKMTAYSKVYCEIGSGSGMHLLERAQNNPDSFYVGFELRYKRAYKTAQKGERRGIKNSYVFRGDAALMFDLFPTSSLDGIYVNFPDPWDKKRWEKHRVLHDTFFEKLYPFLKPDGFFSYKTDHKSYFEKIFELLQSSKIYTVSKHTFDLHHSEYKGDNVLTEFEHLFISKQLPIMFLEATKT